jgi:hypothetical protein
MKKSMPEFAAIPIAIVLLGVMLVILLVSDAGLAAWLVFGAVALLAIVVLAVLAMRRPRGAVAGAPETRFEGSAPHADDGVRRILAVIDDDCSASELEQVAVGAGAGKTSVFVVAPAVSSRMARLTGDEQAYSQAQEQLDRTVQALAGMGVDAKGHVGAHDPLQAADEALREFPADEIVFVLHGGDEKDWLEEDVVELARTRYPVPVREVDGRPA